MHSRSMLPCLLLIAVFCMQGLFAFLGKGEGNLHHLNIGDTRLFLPSAGPYLACAPLLGIHAPQHGCIALQASAGLPVSSQTLKLTRHIHLWGFYSCLPHGQGLACKPGISTSAHCLSATGAGAFWVKVTARRHACRWRIWW